METNMEGGNGKLVSIATITLSNCRGAMNNKELVPCSRRGLLAYVYNGVSD